MEVADDRAAVAEYAQLASVMARMVQLARAGEWGQLPALQTECTTKVRHLQAGPSLAALSPLQRERARLLAERIRADQDEVCRLVKPQLERLVGKMRNLQQVNELRKAYGVMV